MLTLKDPQLSQSHDIPPDGATIGREGGDADITVRSASVSKKHARLYASNGGWWLKDLGSANGTFVGKDRISKPTELRPGSVFTLSGYRFEVASIQAEDGREEDPGATVTGLPPSRLSKPLSDPGGPVFDPPPSRGPSKPAFKAASPPEPEPPSDEELAPPEEQVSSSSHVPSTAGGPVSAGDALKELPKAVAHYMVTVPKLLFNPLGTIRKSVEEQTFPPMRGMPLAGWALPALLLSAGMSVICTFIAIVINAIRGGGFAIGSLITQIITAAIVAVVVTLIIAFLYHPILGFIIKLFRGQSDDQSRTNYLIISQAASILAVVPSGLSLIITLAIVPAAPSIGSILTIIPIVLGLGTTLISIAVFYFWFKFFQVHKVIPMIILVLGGLAALSTLWSVIGAVRAAVSSGGTSATTLAVRLDSGEVQRLNADAQKALADADGNLRKAKAETEAASAEVEKSGAEARKVAGEATRTVPAKAVAAAEEPPPARHAAAVEAKGDSTLAPEAPAAATPFQRYAVHRDFVDKTIAADPTILTHDPQLLAAYKKLQKQRIEVRKARSRQPISPEDVVTQRLVEADQFEKTGKLVEEIYQRLMQKLQ